MMGDVVVRPIAHSDEMAWRVLWTSYLAFYESTVAEDIYVTTFERLLSDDPWMPSGFVAETDGLLVGLVHYIYHSHCWKRERVCYLQDLFAVPQARGTGMGRKLIEAVYAQADRDGAPVVYWMTQEFNAEARQLYDRIGTFTPFIKYQR